ncbi:MAG: bacillithiol biosynthesis BshC [Acidobacteriota bacterium]
MTANDSSSSDASPQPEGLFRIDLSNGRLPALPAALLRDGQDHDLLDPIDLWSPGGDLSRPAPAPSGLVDRASLARALGEANESYGHPAARELAAKLADPATRVVVTGQQPGLLGGPLMALSKTVAALRHVEALEAQGVPAIAVFWVATEDHDWAEIARATVLDQEGPRELDLGEDAAPLEPVGPRPLGAAMEEVARGLESIARGDEAQERLRQVLEIYRPEQTVGDAFIALMIGILGDRAPLYLDALLPAVKEHSAPVLRALIENRSRLQQAYAEADRAVVDRGHALQVHPQPGASPLFLLHEGKRRRIEWRGDDRFALRGLEDFEASVDELLELLAGPAVSPGVLARPAVQDALLGTTLSVLGPAELSYMAQAKATHALLGLGSVHTTLRPQTLALEGRHAGWLEQLDLPLEELLGRPVDESLAERLADDVVTPVRRRIAEQLASLEVAVLGIDKTLEKPLRKTGDQIDRGLDALTSKISAAVARRHDVWRKRIEQVKTAVLPGGTLQERTLATAFLWIKHGETLVEALFEDMDLDPRRMSILHLDRSRVSRSGDSEASGG